MRKFVWPALFICLFLLQGSFWLICPQWPTFDILLPTVYFFALMHGEIAGFFAGFLIGFLQDALVPGIFGFHMLSRCIIGYVVGIIKERVFSDEYMAHVPIIGMISVFIKLSVIAVNYFAISSFKFISWYLWDTIGYVLMNMVLTIPIFYLIKKLRVWVNNDEAVYAAVAMEERKKLKQEYIKSNEGLRYKREYQQSISQDEKK